MANSILEKEYNKVNIKEKEFKTIYQTVNVSFLDVLASNEVLIEAKDYKPCLCKDSNNLKDYFIECSKCNGSGVIKLNNHELVCNECKGEKYVRIHDCYLCNNENRILVNSQIKIKLNKDLKQGDLIDYKGKDYTLKLKLNIYDIDDYLIKDKDIYYLRSIKYSKEDYNHKVNKEIKTYKDIYHLKSEFKVKKEIRCIENGGIDGGNFYFIFENEVNNEVKEIFTNVLIDRDGYVSIKSLIESELVVAKKSIPVNAKGYFYLDENINDYLDDNYHIKFNKLDSNHYVIENNKLMYVLNLDKEDLNNDKKSVILNNEKINVNFKKNLKEISYVNVMNKGIFTKDGKRENLEVKIIPYFENIYKISIKNNKKTIYVDDYKYDDYRLVTSYKKSDYLEDYLVIDKEDKVTINDDLVLIKRV